MDLKKGIGRAGEPSCFLSSSRLRSERQRRNRILAGVVRGDDVRLKDSGVTESLVSAWELGKHRTSAQYQVLSDTDVERYAATARTRLRPAS